MRFERFFIISFRLLTFVILIHSIKKSYAFRIYLSCSLARSNVVFATFWFCASDKRANKSFHKQKPHKHTYGCAYFMAFYFSVCFFLFHKCLKVFQWFLIHVKNEKWWKSQAQFNSSINLMLFAQMTLIKWTFPFSEICNQTEKLTYARTLTQIGRHLGQASYAMCLSSKLHFRVKSQ